MYNISLRFNSSVDLFLCLCLGSWRYHCSEGWGSCVILNGDFFCNTGPGVGIRILALVLLTCVFCPVQAVPSRDLPMSVPRECEGRFRHPPALSSMQCLQTVRMPFCPVGFDCLLSFWSASPCNTSGCWASWPVAVWVLFLSFLSFFP